VIAIVHLQIANLALKRAVALVGAAVVAANFSVAFAGYRHMIQPRDKSDTLENDVYRVALQFMKAMPKSTGRPGELLFLYDTRQQSLDSIQSTYLWGYSLVKYNRGAAAAGDSLEPKEIATLKDDDRYLGLISESRDEVEFESQDLQRHGIPLRRVEQRTMSSGSYTIYFELLEVGQIPGASVLNGDFEAGISPWSGGWATLRTLDGGQSGKCLELKAEQGPSQYAIEWNLIRLRPGGHYRLSFWVKSGSSGDEAFIVGLWDPQAMSWAASQSGRSTGTWTEFDVPFTNTSPNRLSLELMKNSPTKGSMLFDSVRLAALD
jgi:hypothetical protein